MPHMVIAVHSGLPVAVLIADSGRLQSALGTQSAERSGASSPRVRDTSRTWAPYRVRVGRWKNPRPNMKCDAAEHVCNSGRHASVDSDDSLD